MAPKKPRCQLNEKTENCCRSPAQPILGSCDFCKKVYCSKHRLLEDHKCPGLEDCKQQSYARNAAQLESERTQVIRTI